MTDRAGGRWHHRRVSEMEPRISVIMAVYNGERYVSEAVDSILAPTLSDLELVVVNDGSFDSGRVILVNHRETYLLVIQRLEARPIFATPIDSRVAIQIAFGKRRA